MAHRIDVQHHLLPQAYVRAVGRDRIADTIVSNQCPDWTAEVSLEAMDRNGIATAMLSLAAPGFHFDSAADAAALARLCNDEAAAICAQYPGRFGFFATLPLPHIDESLAEVDRALDGLGADGICLLTNYGGHYLGDARLAPVLGYLNARNTVAFVHPSDIEGGRPLPHLPAATLEFPFETTRAITNLLFSGQAARLRDLWMIFSHAGGTIPFLADRISRLERRPDLACHVPDGALAEMKRFYFDIALSAGARTLQPLLDFVPPSQILFASDFPFAGEDTMAATVRALNGQGLSVDVVSTIEAGAAQALFPARRMAAVPPQKAVISNSQI